MMDDITRKAIEDTHKVMEENHNNIVDNFNEAMGKAIEVIAAGIQELAEKVLLMDEALAHFATRLDQIEQVMGLENPTVDADTTAEETHNG